MFWQVGLVFIHGTFFIWHKINLTSFFRKCILLSFLLYLTLMHFLIHLFKNTKNFVLNTFGRVKEPMVDGHNFFHAIVWSKELSILSWTTILFFLTKSWTTIFYLLFIFDILMEIELAQLLSIWILNRAIVESNSMEAQ